jgi:hypothetical protein
MHIRTRGVLALVIALGCTPIGFAATSATGTNTVSPTLVVNVTVAKAIQLTLATGALGSTPCAVNAGGGGDYNVSFGTVDALGITAPTCGAHFTPTTPGVSPSVYYADYQLTPIFTSQAVSTNTVSAYVSSNFAKSNLSIVQANSTPASIAGLTAMSTSAGAQTSVATNATSGTALTRYVGVSVAPTNGASLTGADTATVTFTMTVH